MEQYKIGNATVRIHGSADHERLKLATIKFLKEAEKQKRKIRNESRTRTSLT